MGGFCERCAERSDLPKVEEEFLDQVLKEQSASCKYCTVFRFSWQRSHFSRWRRA